MSVWYNFLVPNPEKKPALLDRNKINEKNIVICWQKKFRKYAIFDSYISLVNFLEKTKTSQHCFYEVIFDKTQKIYFDIDSETEIISQEDSKIEIKIIVEYLGELLSKKVKDYQIQVYSSNSDLKISYHIVVDKVYVSGVKDNSNFFNEFMEFLPSSLILKQYFDSSMYKRTQQYRLLGSTKYNKNRYKVAEFDLFRNPLGWGYDLSKYGNDRARYFNILKTSLVSLVTTGEMIYFDYSTQIIEKPRSEGSITIEDSHIEEAIKRYKKVTGSFPFQVKEIIPDEYKNCLVSLQRLTPSFCSICNRTHQSENPYFIFWGDELNISFDCRRNQEGNRLHLGKIIEPVQEVKRKDNFVNKIVFPF